MPTPAAHHSLPKSSKHTHGPRTGPNNTSAGPNYRARNAADGLTIHTLASPRTLTHSPRATPSCPHAVHSATHPRARFPRTLRLEGEELVYTGVFKTLKYNRREGQGTECGTHGAELTTSDGEISFRHCDVVQVALELQALSLYNNAVENSEPRASRAPRIQRCISGAAKPRRHRRQRRHHRRPVHRPCQCATRPLKPKSAPTRPTI